MRDFINRKNLPEVFAGTYIALILTVFLLWFDKSGYSAITEAKLPLFYVFSGAYIFLTLAAAAIGGRVPKLKELSAVQLFVIAYLIFTLLSAVCSPFQSKTWIGATRYEGALTIAIYCLVFLLISVYGRAGKWLLWPLGIGAVLLCLLCISQMHGKNPFCLYPNGYDYFGAGKYYSGQYLGTVGNTGLLAAYFCVAIPVMWLSLLRLKGKKRFLLFVPLILSLFVLIKMSVMAGLLGVFGGGILSIPIVIKSDRKTRKIIVVILLAAIIFGIAFLFLADIGEGTLHEAHEVLHGNVSESFGSHRIYIWKNVLELVPRRLILGMGPDTLSAENVAPFTRYEAEIDELFTSYIDTAHNEYLNVLYHQGLFALIAYLAALIAAAVKWIKQSEKNTVVAIMGAAALSYCIQAFFGISMFISAPFFWISLALLESSCNKKPML